MAATGPSAPQQVLDLFTKKYSKWSFDSSSTGFNAYWDKINTQAAGGALPDIILMDMRYIGQFTQRSQLLDLTKYADAELNLGDFDKGQREQATIKGKVYGVSLGGNLQSLLQPVGDPAGRNAAADRQGELGGVRLLL